MASRIVRTLVIVGLLALGVLPAAGQEGLPAADGNPLAELNGQLTGVLASASVPFSEEQERAVALMMEERLRASEELFGNLMDFRDGPTRGENEDRLRSAIAWMRGEFLKRLADYLTPEQAAAWQAHQAREASAAKSDATAGPAPPAQTQFVRINNNALTAEWGNYNSGGGGTDVIQRGGAGAWHGNAQLLLKDDALNARNAFASNKPSYQERQINVDVSGPAIPGRLTSTFLFNQSESENVDTVNATLPTGVFQLGITKPNRWRQIATRGTLQQASAHTLNFYVGYNNEVARNQGVGGFNLPERASHTDWHAWNVELTQFSSLSARTIVEGRLQMNRNQGESIPASTAERINVLDAFSSGGAQNAGVDNQHNYNFSSRLTRLGEKVTVKTGIEGAYRSKRSSSTNNFGGTYTFSSLAAYLAGTPLTYRVTRGNPLVETTQLELATYVQGDVTLTEQLTLLAGLRYDRQTNLDDRNNLAPRAAMAYSPGQATVIRVGGGLYYQRLNFGMVENQRRFDGTRQYEIVIDNPTYPDPFVGGTVRQTLQSVRVTDPNLAATRVAVGMLSLERTFRRTFIVTATYDVQREYGRLRTRNLNAPFDATFPVRRSCSDTTPVDACITPHPLRGNIINLESTGNEIRHNLRVNARQRFSVFNVSGYYRMEWARGDVQGGAGTALTDNYDLRADSGRAPFPLHTAGTTVNARLPLGLFLTGSVNGNSGRYYTITTGIDNNRDSSVTDRPTGVPPTSERGPRYMNVDFNLSKAFFLRGRSGANANMFVNLTNALNHVHYGTPSGVLTSPNFGKSISASNPREIEMGVRFQF